MALFSFETMAPGPYLASFLVWYLLDAVGVLRYLENNFIVEFLAVSNGSASVCYICFTLSQISIA